MITTTIAAIILVLAIAWVLIGSLLCCEIRGDETHWWCPICLVFGKRFIP